MTLDDLRTDIDKIDARILSLLNERMEKAILTKKFKTSIVDTSREQIVLDKIRRSSHCLVEPKFAVDIYSFIISESKRLQAMGLQTIGFQGEHGAYSEVAARALLPQSAMMPCREFSDVFESVESGIFDCGIVPVENTLGGLVGPVNSILIYTNLKIIAAVDMPVKHCLLCVPGTDHRELRNVWSHSQALAQCRNFIARNHLEAIPYYDTAGAARTIAETRPKGVAVIASKFCADLYGLEIIKEDIQDSVHNRTRFFVVAMNDGVGDGDRCSAVFTAGDKAGSLFAILKVFANASINLTRIESVPDTPGKYAIFIDFQGSIKDAKVASVIAKAEEMAEDFRVLGCYKETRLQA
ncbi:MAG TPA: bifunctional chorismate mutase/prephenate dehydratase [Spirochaetaceae bacterium]|nr:bifunctional chorismate mutase/prephenate dehydratase [Spirochaetaceae bacterium]